MASYFYIDKNGNLVVKNEALSNNPTIADILKIPLKSNTTNTQNKSTGTLTAAERQKLRELGYTMGGGQYNLNSSGNIAPGGSFSARPLSVSDIASTPARPATNAQSYSSATTPSINTNTRPANQTTTVNKLTDEQILGLNAAAARVAAGTDNEADRTNLNYAVEILGYKFPTMRGTTNNANQTNEVTENFNIKRDGADFLVGDSRPNASNLDQWKNGTNLIEAARNIIQMKQNYNTDIQTAKQYWREQATDTTSWEGQGKKQFAELSPTEQADLRASKYKTAQAHITGLNEEAEYRRVRSEDKLKYINDYYNEKIKQLESQKANARADKQLEIQERQVAMQEERNRIANSKDIADFGLDYKYDDDGRLVVDNDLYNMPAVNSKVQISNVGTGTVTAYGSDLWAYGLDIALDGGTSADVKIPFDFKIIQAAPNGNFGNQVKVVDVNTGQELWVSHLSSFNRDLLATGTSGTVHKAGTSVGKQGNTGATIGKTGIHVDFTMPNGDGTYKTAQEVALALGIGSLKTRGQANTIKATDSERKKFKALTGLPDDLIPVDIDTINTLTMAYAEAYKQEALDLITNGLSDEGLKPLKQELVMGDKVYTPPDPKIIFAYLKDRYKGKLSDDEILFVMNQAGYDKGGGMLDNPWYELQ